MSRTTDRDWKYRFEEVIVKKEVSLTRTHTAVYHSRLKWYLGSSCPHHAGRRGINLPRCSEYT
jgi:hypothetical protein